MNLDDLKDQLKDQSLALIGRIQETSLFNTAKEKFLNLPSSAQQAIMIGAGILTTLFIFSIPFSYINSADVALEEFSETRAQLRDLLKVSRASKDPAPLPPGMSTADLEQRAKSTLANFNLIPEQIVKVTPLGERPAGSMAPPIIDQAGVAIHLKKINLAQAVDIGHALQGLSTGIKLTGLDLAANSEDNHYYDAVFMIVNFSLPVAAEEPEGPSRKGGAEDSE